MAQVETPTWATHLTIYKQRDALVPHYSPVEKTKLIGEIKSINKEIKLMLNQFSKGGTPSGITSALKTISISLATLYKTIEERFYPQSKLSQF
tara:strand:- start:12448 stop:12726 length:279 start_codon:yes stop_codon:yes gene_type:complete